MLIWVNPILNKKLLNVRLQNNLILFVSILNNINNLTITYKYVSNTGSNKN